MDAGTHAFTSPEHGVKEFCVFFFRTFPRKDFGRDGEILEDFLVRSSGA